MLWLACRFCPVSLLTGNLTGNLATSGASEMANNGAVTGLTMQIAYSTRPESKSPPDKIFGTKHLWVMSAITQKRTLIAGAGMPALCQKRNCKQARSETTLSRLHVGAIGSALPVYTNRSAKFTRRVIGALQSFPRGKADIARACRHVR